ncbi:hypothetical protein AwWohl_08020 [Gammaproteobacteria bacterium]|nr:hypothetical protein AwWohl_08020 [Gammaproteobacteria bacterium]
MASYKTLFNNKLMLDKFISMFGVNANTAKNKLLIDSYLNYGLIAA